MKTFFALALAILFVCPAAQSEPISANITGPTEVGTSAMPPGQCHTGSYDFHYRCNNSSYYNY